VQARIIEIESIFCQQFRRRFAYLYHPRAIGVVEKAAAVEHLFGINNRFAFGRRKNFVQFRRQIARGEQLFVVTFADGQIDLDALGNFRVDHFHRRHYRRFVDVNRLQRYAFAIELIGSGEYALANLLRTQIQQGSRIGTEVVADHAIGIGRMYRQRHHHGTIAARAAEHAGNMQHRFFFAEVEQRRHFAFRAQLE